MTADVVVFVLGVIVVADKIAEWIVTAIVIMVMAIALFPDSFRAKYVCASALVLGIERVKFVKRLDFRHKLFDPGYQHH